MIQVHTVEQRTMVQGGQPPVTIIRQVDMKNGHGTKKVQVLRGNQVLAQESATLNFMDRQNVQRRKTSSVHKSLERKTLKKLNASKKQVATQRKLNASKKQVATQRKLNASKKQVATQRKLTSVSPKSAAATKKRKTVRREQTKKRMGKTKAH